MIRILIYCSSVLYCLVAHPVKAQLHGTSPEWTIPAIITKPHTTGDVSKGGIGQNIIRLDNGDIIQCFSEVFPFPNGDAKIYLAKSTDDGNSWTTIINYAPTLKTSIVFAPTIAKDTSDNIHLIWQRNVPSKDIYYSKMDKEFNIIIDTARITQAKFHDCLHSAYLTVDRLNRLHVMWHDGDTDSTGNPDYFTKTLYRQSTDGGNSWSPQILLSDTSIHKHAAFPRANFSGVEGNTLAIPWRQFNGTPSQNWDVWMAYSIDGGLTWNRRLAAGTLDVEWDPGILIDKNNRIHIHYHEYKNGNLQMATMEYGYTDDLGITWSPSTHKPISPDGKRGQLSVFSYDYQSDIQCICWKDERDYVNAKDPRSDVMCSFTIDRGSTWQGQEFVTDHDTIALGFKSVEVGSNNTLYVSYEYADSTGRKSIYFSRRAISNASDLMENKKAQLQVSPNPCNYNIYVDIPSNKFNTYVIYALDGKIVDSGKLTFRSIIQTINLTNGMYFIKCMDRQNSIGTFFIKNE